MPAALVQQCAGVYRIKVAPLAVAPSTFHTCCTLHTQLTESCRDSKRVVHKRDNMALQKGPRSSVHTIVFYCSPSTCSRSSFSITVVHRCHSTNTYKMLMISCDLNERLSFSVQDISVIKIYLFRNKAVIVPFPVSDWIYRLKITSIKVKSSFLRY